MFYISNGSQIFRVKLPHLISLPHLSQFVCPLVSYLRDRVCVCVTVGLRCVLGGLYYSAFIHTGRSNESSSLAFACNNMR